MLCLIGNTSKDGKGWSYKPHIFVREVLYLRALTAPHPRIIFTCRRLQHGGGLGSCLRSIPGAHSHPGAAPWLVRRCLSRRRAGSPSPLAAGAGDEARAAPRAGAGASRSRPRAGRRECTGAGSSPRVSTPRGGPDAAARFPSLPLNLPPPSPPLLQNRRSRCDPASFAPVPVGERAALAAGTARGGSSPAASPPPHCHGRGRGPALTMLLGAPRAGGWDRGRVGERLQAALAGLQELQVLREKQRELVRAALAMPQRPVAGGAEQPLSAHSKEHRLEATLTALKEQLVRDGTGRPAAPGAAVLRAGGRRGALPGRPAQLCVTPRSPVGAAGAVSGPRAGRALRLLPLPLLPHRRWSLSPQAGASGGARGGSLGRAAATAPVPVVITVGSLPRAGLT